MTRGLPWNNLSNLYMYKSMSLKFPKSLLSKGGGGSGTSNSNISLLILLDIQLCAQSLKSQLMTFGLCTNIQWVCIGIRLVTSLPASLVWLVSSLLMNLLVFLAPDILAKLIDCYSLKLITDTPTNWFDTWCSNLFCYTLQAEPLVSTATHQTFTFDLDIDHRFELMTYGQQNGWTHTLLQTAFSRSIMISFLIEKPWTQPWSGFMYIDKKKLCVIDFWNFFTKKENVIRRDCKMSFTRLPFIKNWFRKVMTL